MSTLSRARIIPALEPGVPDDGALPLLTAAHHRRIVATEARARDDAADLVARAHAEATTIIAEARRLAELVARDAAREAKEAEESKLAALFLQMKRDDDARAVRDLDRAIALAVILAERLLGSALVLDPTVIQQLAHQALAEARGAHSATIEASPLDADVLQRHLEAAGFAPHSVEIRREPSLERGALRILTNVGAVDAELHPQLERLARILRDTLHRG